MPRIPQYIQDKLASSLMNVVPASGAGLNTAGSILETAGGLATSLGRASRTSAANNQQANLLGIAGQAFENLSYELRVRQAQQARREAEIAAANDEAAIANVSVPIHQKMIDQFRLVEQQHVDAKGMLNDWRQSAPLILEEYLNDDSIKGNPNREQGVKKVFTQLMNSYDGRLSDIGTTKEINVNQGVAKQNIDSIIKFAGSSPDELNFSNAFDQLDALAPTIARYFKPHEAEGLMKSAQEAISDNWMRALIDSDTQKARKVLETQQWVKAGTISRKTHDALEKTLIAQEKDNMEVLDAAEKLEAQGAKQRINDLYHAALQSGTKAGFQKAQEQIDALVETERSKKVGRNETVVNFGIGRSESLDKRKSDDQIARAEQKALIAEARSATSWAWGLEGHKIQQEKRRLDDLRKQPENQKKIVNATNAFGIAASKIENPRNHVNYLNDAWEKTQELFDNQLISDSDYFARMKVIEQKRLEAFNKLPKFSGQRPFNILPSSADKAASSMNFEDRFGYYLGKGAPADLIKAFGLQDDPAGSTLLSSKFMSELADVVKRQQDKGIPIPLIKPDNQKDGDAKTLDQLVETVVQYMKTHKEEYQ